MLGKEVLFKENVYVESSTIAALPLIANPSPVPVPAFCFKAYNPGVPSAKFFVEVISEFTKTIIASPNQSLTLVSVAAIS